MWAARLLLYTVRSECLQNAAPTFCEIKYDDKRVNISGHHPAYSIMLPLVCALRREYRKWPI